MSVTVNPSYRFALLGFILSAVAALLVVPVAVAQEQDASTGLGFVGVRAQDCPAPETPEEVRVYRLEHAEAAFLARMLKETLPVPTLVADPRINSLIVSGSSELIAKFETILANLDVRSVADERHIRVYPVQHRPAGDALQRMITHMLGDRSVRISTDSARSLVIVAGNNAHHRTVQEILAEVDTPIEEPADTQARQTDPQFMDYRFIWLLADADLGAPGEVPVELQEVILEMDALGITDLHVMARSSVRTGEGTFEARIVSPTKGGMVVKGKTAWIEEGRPTLDVQLTGTVHGEEAPHTFVATNLSPVMGRPMAIAFPHGELTSVFVVQITQP